MLFFLFLPLLCQIFLRLLLVSFFQTGIIPRRLYLFFPPFLFSL